MVQLVDCVKTELAVETRQPAPSTAVVSGQPAAPLQNPVAPQEAQLEEIQLATNFFLAAQLPNARVLTKSETPIELSSFGAAWKARGGLGGVKTFPARPGLTGLMIASDLIGTDSQSCKGKFASARSSELVDSDVVFRAATSCADSENERSAEYFIAPRPSGGFVAFLILAVTESERQETARPDCCNPSTTSLTGRPRRPALPSVMSGPGWNFMIGAPTVSRAAIGAVQGDRRLLRGVVEEKAAIGGRARRDQIAAGIAKRCVAEHVTVTSGKSDPLMVAIGGVAGH